MKILSLNIRGTQGGAGRMGYDLFRRQRSMGHDGELLYGYGSGIAPDPGVAGDADVAMLANRPGVLVNFASHLLIGREIVQPGRSRLRGAMAAADVVHIHAAHHWYLHWQSVVDMLVELKRPVVLTAHDWWLVSGRCGFVRDCEGWRRACGECGKRRFEDLPALLDWSRPVRASRQANLRRLTAQLAVVAPSEHLARDHSAIYPDLDVRFIPNSLDREFEAIVQELPGDQVRSGIVFCASDLASPGKMDAALVRRLAADMGAAVHLAGRASPFGDTPATDHGEVRDRRQLAELFHARKALVFTSQMDNAPLTLIEALTCGTHVVAYPSPAAAEMLALVGGRCAASAAEAEAILRADAAPSLYGGADHAELADRARQAWSGTAMATAYLTLYDELLARGRQAA